MPLTLSLSIVDSQAAVSSLMPTTDATNGPYSQGLNDPTNTFDAPIPGFIGPDGEGKARLDDGEGNISNPRNFVNPLFFGWGLSWTNYVRSDGQSSFNAPSFSLGPVTGDNFGVVSLGDLSAAQITANLPVGKVTLRFTSATQTIPIRNLTGADFVVFENSFYSSYNTGGAGIGGLFGELAYVEVSSDGVSFARFPCVSLTLSAVGMAGSFNPTNIANLAGKHVNAFGESWGTPFDLNDLATNSLVLAGTVNLNNIQYVRIVDIPGNGTFRDSASPTTHSIYDAWQTTGSGGFDLEAIGVISRSMTFDSWQDLRSLAGTQRGAAADPDRDGVPNLLEYAFGRLPTSQELSVATATVAMLNGRPAISFIRDERATDLLYEVQASDTMLTNSWTTIAQSNAGAVATGVNGHTPLISETRASPITSVGIFRRVQVSDDQPTTGHTGRFMRVKVTLLGSP